LDCIRTLTYLFLDWSRTVNRFENLGSGPNLDWVNGKNCGTFVFKKNNTLLNFGLHLDSDFKLKKILCGAWTEFQKCNTLCADWVPFSRLANEVPCHALLLQNSRFTGQHAGIQLVSGSSVGATRTVEARPRPSRTGCAGSVGSIAAVRRQNCTKDNPPPLIARMTRTKQGPRLISSGDIQLSSRAEERRSQDSQFVRGGRDSFDAEMRSDA